MSDNRSDGRVLPVRIEDAYPLVNGPRDAATLRREEAARTRELTDLPDLMTDADYEAADSAWEGWLEWMAS